MQLRRNDERLSASLKVGEHSGELNLPAVALCSSNHPSNGDQSQSSSTPKVSGGNSSPAFISFKPSDQASFKTTSASCSAPILSTSSIFAKEYSKLGISNKQISLFHEHYKTVGRD